MTIPRHRLLRTAEGTTAAAFGTAEWALLAVTAGIWGSSFVFIEIGLEAFSPGLITSLRLAGGAVTLALFTRARAPIDRADRPQVVLLSILWLAIPTVLFPIAQQWINSSLTGMINAAMPLFTAAIAAVLLRRLPRRYQAAGLIVGFVGIVLLSLPNGEAAGNFLGIALALAATALYGLAVNVAVPLQQKYGALPVLLRALSLAFLFTLPFGVASVPSSSFAWSSLIAVIALGVGGTAIAFVTMATLAGRVGAIRASVAIYFIPMVAIVLGVFFLDEAVTLTALAGVALILLGAYFTSREEVRISTSHPPP